VSRDASAANLAKVTRAKAALAAVKSNKLVTRLAGIPFATQFGNVTTDSRTAADAILRGSALATLEFNCRPIG